MITKKILLLASAVLTAQSPLCVYGEDIPELEPYLVSSYKRDILAQDLNNSLTLISDVQNIDYGIKSVIDLVTLVPNLYITETGNSMMNTFATTRGIPGSMKMIPSVGFYVDDVYYPGIDMSLFDVERIEVLYGPQGTLYGRNSEAGVINVITRKPDGTNRVSVSAEASMFDTYEGTFSVEDSLLDGQINVRGSLRYHKSNGYFENLYDGSSDGGEEENIDGRFIAKTKLLKTIDITLGYDLQRYESPKNAQFAAINTEGEARKSVNVDFAGRADKDADGIFMRAEKEMDLMKIISISSWRDESYYCSNDIDFMPIDLMTLKLNKDVSSFSEEIRLVSNEDNSTLKWIAGAFLLSEDEDHNYQTWMNFANMGMGVPGEYLNDSSQTETFNSALFGEATYPIMDKVELTLGLRYEREKKDFDYSQNPSGFILPMMGYSEIEGSGSETYSAWLPKGVISYKFTDALRTYVSVSRGFKSGGLNDNENMGSTFDPEYTWNYEIGLKSAWLENRLQVNASFYYIDWSDMQVEILTSGGSSVYIDNAGEATSKGFEIQLLSRPLKGLELMMGFGYSDSKYDDYSKGEQVFDGNRVIDSPEYTVNTGLTYRFSNGIFLSSSYTYFGEIEYNPENTSSQEGYGLAHMKMGYETEKFDIYLFARNLFDKEYYTRAVNVSDVWYGRAGEPQTFGVATNLRF